MKTPKQPLILYFVLGVKLTAEDAVAVSKLKGRIGYRNAQHIDPSEPVEPCDGVAGAVPANYKKKYPSAEKAIKAYEDEVAEIAKAAGDKPAPSPTAFRGTPAPAAATATAPAAGAPVTPVAAGDKPPAAGGQPAGAWGKNPGG